MRTDSRLSRMLHVLLHMAQHQQPFTSDQIAGMLDTNPVVIRRTMAGLREAGYVQAGKGPGGGWTLVCDPRKVTLLDIHRALGTLQLFTIGNESDNPACLVARAVNDALEDALQEAESILVKKLASITLADIARDLQTSRRKRPNVAKSPPPPASCGYRHTPPRSLR